MMRAPPAGSPSLDPRQFVATTLVLTCAVALQLAWMPPAYVALLLAGIGARLVHRTLRQRAVHALVRGALIAVLLWAAWVVLSPIGQRAAFGGLLASMLSLKLLETERVRDARLVVAFGCFLAMTAFLFDQGPVQTAFTALFVLLAFAALHELVPGREPAAPLATMRRALQYGLLLVALALPFALVAFVLFPRLDRPLWSGTDEARTGRTGISNRLEPGQLSALALDDTPAFRVTFDGPLPPPSERYFRGQVFWLFDGRGWGWEGQLEHERHDNVEVLGPATEYVVTMAPTDQRWLFLLDTPIASTRGDLGGDRVVRMRRPIDQTIEFRGTSATRYRTTGELSVDARRMALWLPQSGNAQSRALAQSWRARHGGDADAIVREALALYHASFTYSLDPPLLGAEPIDDFLFASRIGFCEHYASSFTYLMRAAGVPARVVGGYLGGYYNRAGGFLTVLNSDAHAWAEVWIEGRGWVRVDPTAAVAPERVERSAREWRGGDQVPGALGTTLREGVDVLGAWWNRMVIQFNAAAQRNLMSRLGFPDWSARELAIAMVVAGAATLALAGALGFRGRRRRTEPAVAAWHRLGQRLARAGVPRAPNEGPAAYAERAAAALPDDADEIRALSADFVRLRYAAATIASDATSRFRNAVRRFKPTRATARPRRPSS